MKIQATVELQIPDDHEWTGEWRPTGGGEPWTDGDGKVFDFRMDAPVFILRKKTLKVIVFVPDENGELVQSGEGMVFYRFGNPQGKRYRREEREETAQ